MKRTKLIDRLLPDYTKGEEIFNMVSHIVGGAFGVIALVSCVIVAAVNGNISGIVGGSIYGVSMITLYTISSIYHGLKPNDKSSIAKKVMQVIDHCTIYFLIAGTYTVVVLSAIRPVYPLLAWGIFVFEWAMTALAATFTAIDHKRYGIFSMICYIGMGWAIIPFWRQTWQTMTKAGFLLLFIGGIAYTIGSILYGIGVKNKRQQRVYHMGFVNIVRHKNDSNTARLC